MSDTDNATLNAPLVFSTCPEEYHHIQLKIDGPIARIILNIQEDHPARPGYKLKLNSYDIGVDIELADAVNRLRFEHPEVSVVCIESALDTIFCAGANIFMLGQSSHSHKVNFCRYTNETRINIEEATQHSNQFYVAALNGISSGGGYELALACEEIHLIDDHKSAVSLPEVPFLGVLPGTGGLTRLVDKRKVRRDLSDIFCTTAEGVKGKKAVKWKLVDFVHPSSKFEAKITERLTELAGDGNQAKGITLNRIEASVSGNQYRYTYVTLEMDPQTRLASITIKGPSAEDASIPDDPTTLGSEWYALQVWRELLDAIYQLRFNNETIGVVSIHTEGSIEHVLALDDALQAHKSHWFIREVLLQQGRVLKALDVTAKSLFTLVTPDSCFAGSFLEIALASDRIYMLEDSDTTRLCVHAVNADAFKMPHGLTRLQNRFYQDDASIKTVLGKQGTLLDAEEASDLGLVTDIFDEIDWDDEIRVLLEERASLSPDALTGLEANLRFVGPETCDSRIFGRLSAWQNWIFTRPNATGEEGALTSYGKAKNAVFNWSRV
jgi:benzoyl-CoA-dihydrodiol lyase